MPAAGRGNAIAEWYGFRVWPFVDDSERARDYQTTRDCPFITAATGTRTACIKPDRTGVCTISSPSNGPRQDWLACPFRILDTHFTLLDAIVRRLYGVMDATAVVRPASARENPRIRQELARALQDDATRVFLFSQQGLGGEVKVPPTAGSPPVEIDISVAEVVLDRRSPTGFDLAQYAFVEIQTMDFHGSPKHAITNLQRLREANPLGYHADLRRHPELAGDRVEGPNKANVFKRTIYQTILKIQLARTAACAGFAIALPQPVWDSWQRHLGMPRLVQDGAIWRLTTPHVSASDPATPAHRDSGPIEADRAWIFVFDIDRDSEESPQPLKIVQTIATTSVSLIYYAFERAPEMAIAEGAMAVYERALRKRLGLPG